MGIMAKIKAGLGFNLAANEFGQSGKDEIADRVTARGAKPYVKSLIDSGLDATRWDIWTDELSTEWVARALKQAEAGQMLAQYSLMEQMEERDPALHSAMMTRRAGPAACTRVLIPAQHPQHMSPQATAKKLDFDEQKARDVTADVEWVMTNIDNFDGFIYDALDAVGKGIAVCEIDWSADKDGTIDSIRHVNPRLYNFDSETGDLYLVNTEDPLGVKKIFVKNFDYKFVVHRSKMRAGHASRAGALRSVAWCYVFRNYAWKDQSVYCEIFGMPMRVGKYKPTATPADKNQLAAMLKQMASNSWALISETTEIKFEEAMNRGQEPFTAFLNALRSEYFLAILGQEGTNVAAKYGSKGDSQVKQLVRQDILEADCKQLENTIKWQLIYPIVLYRWGQEIADTYTPTLHFKYEPPLLLAQEAEIDTKMLVEAGLGRYVSARALCAKYGYEMVDPSAPDDERVLPKDFQPGKITVMPDAPGTGPASDKAGAAAKKPTSGPSGKADNAKVQSDNTKRNAVQKLMGTMSMVLARKFNRTEEEQQGAIDEFVKLMADNADETMSATLSSLVEVVSSAKNYSELKMALESAFADLDTDEVQKALGWSMMMGRLFGRKAVIESTNAG